MTTTFAYLLCVILVSRLMLITEGRIVQRYLVMLSIQIAGLSVLRSCLPMLILVLSMLIANLCALAAELHYGRSLQELQSLPPERKEQSETQVMTARNQLRLVTLL